MSDMILDIDSSQVVNAKQALGSLSDDWAKMVNRVVAENKRMETAVKASSQVTMLALDKALAAEAKQNNNAWFERQRRKMSMMQASAALEQKVAADAVRAKSQEEAATRRTTLATQNQSRAIEQLKVKYQPLYAASKQYERALEEIELAYQTGVVSSQQYKASVASLGTEFTDFQNGTAGWSNQFVNGSNRSARSMNSLGAVTQQVGYQVGDFAVQVQSGQSALVAFSQQATQLVGVLPQIAEELGLTMIQAIGLSAGLGIAIPIITGIAGLLYTVSREAEDAADSIETFEDKLKSARGEFKKSTEALELLASGFDNIFLKTFSDQVKNAEKEVSDLELAIKRARDVGGKGNAMLAGGRSESLKEAQQSLLNARAELATYKELNDQEIERARNKSVNNQLSEVRQTLDELERVAREETLKDMQSANELRATELAHGKDSLEVLMLQQDEQTRILEKKIKDEQLSTQLAGALREALGIAQNFARLDMGLSIRNATIDTNALIGRLSEAVRLARWNEMVKNSPMLGLDDERGSQEGETISGGTFRANQTLDTANERSKEYLDPKDPKKGKAAKADKDDFIESMKKKMAQREELLKLFGKERDLQEEIFRIQDGLGAARSEYSDEAIKAIAKENLLLAEQEDLYDKSMERMQSVADFMQEAWVDAFETIFDNTKTAEEKFKSFAKSIIDQLLQIIITQKLVGSFDMATGQGNGIMGFLGPLLGGLGGFRAEGGPVNANTPYMVGEREPELFVPRTAGTIFNQKQMGMMGSGGSQKVELIITSPDGVTIQQVRGEVDVQIKKAAPIIVGQSVKSSQKAIKYGPKGAFGL
jgi:hypothetical protein